MIRLSGRFEEDMHSAAVETLRRTHLFAPLAVGELEALASSAPAMIHLLAGQTLFDWGDEATHLYIVVAGELELILPTATPSALPARLLPFDTIGEEEVLTRSLHVVTARAGAAAATLMAIPAQALLAHLERHFDSAIAMISGMANLLRGRVREISELKMQSTVERLASFLLSLAGSAEGRATVRLPCEKRLLAGHLGMDPATLSRAFAKLREWGVAASRSDKVEIDDVARLRDYGNSAAFPS